MGVSKSPDYGQHPTDLYPDVLDAIDRAKVGDASGLETMIRFLESDAYSLGSGYLRSDTIHVLTRLDLNDSARRRLGAVLLAGIDGPTRREFKALGRLARRLDEPLLRAAVEGRVRGPSERTSAHAHWILNAMGPKPPA